MSKAAGSMPARTGPRRILICTNAYPPNFVGGAELMAHEQALALTRLGYVVHVFAGDPDAPRERYSRHDDVYEGIRIHRIALTPEDYSPEYLNFLHPAVEAHFCSILTDFEPDIVHCHNLMGLSAKLPLFARQQGAGIVCTLHDFWGFCLRNTAMRSNASACTNIAECQICLPRIHDGSKRSIPMKARKDFLALALAQIDCFIAPSHFVARRYSEAGFPKERITVIRNGIAVNRFSHPRMAPSTHSAHALRITFAGHFGAHKGVATLIEALALTSNTVLQLVGTGPEQKVYAERITTLGLENRVQFLGKVAPADMPGIYACSDLVILPSIWPENQPVCLMEAMAAGVPVVASRLGGIPELIEHGVNGLLFSAGDAHDLAKQITRMALEPAFRQAAGKAGKQRVAMHDHDRQALLLTAIYDRISAPLHLDQNNEGRRDIAIERDIYFITGSKRRHNASSRASTTKILASPANNERYCIPASWLAGCIVAVRGIVPTGRFGNVLAMVKPDPSLRLPHWLTRFLVRRRPSGQAPPSGTFS